MSEDAQNGPESDGSGPVAGELLAKARQAREISIQEIAKDLHLDEHKVRALEHNQFDLLGAPVFAKGYLRKYAELVGVPIDDVIAGYYRLNRSAGLPPLVTTRPSPMRESSPVPWLAALAIVLVAGLLAFWWFTSGPDWFRGGAEEPAPVPTATEEDRPPVREAEGASAQPDAVEADTGSAAGPAAARPPASVDAPRAEATRPAGATDGNLALRLAFSGDCWTEVTDAGGDRLYFGLGSSGDEVSVDGEPPLNVLLGDSENVAVFVDGVAYPIPASARRGETARLTLTAR